MARVKNVEAFCSVCGTVRKMEITGESSTDSDIKKWAKCKKCKQTMIIDLTVKVKEDVPTIDELNMERSIEYTPAKTYEIGQSIYHKNWDDFGLVISKEVLSNGKSSILVEFQKSGSKKLIENINS